MIYGIGQAFGELGAVIKQKLVSWQNFCAETIGEKTYLLVA